MRKKCPECGRFMANGFPFYEDTQQLDSELARAWELTPEQIQDAEVWLEGEGAKFVYVTEEFYCEPCNYSEPREDGKRWYWNDDHMTFDAPRPLTPAQVVAQENAAQEAAGQLRLIE